MPHPGTKKHPLLPGLGGRGEEENAGPAAAAAGQRARESRVRGRRHGTPSSSPPPHSPRPGGCAGAPGPLRAVSSGGGDGGGCCCYSSGDPCPSVRTCLASRSRGSSRPLPPAAASAGGHGPFLPLPPGLAVSSPPPAHLTPPLPLQPPPRPGTIQPASPGRGARREEPRARARGKPGARATPPRARPPRSGLDPRAPPLLPLSPPSLPVRLFSLPRAQRPLELAGSRRVHLPRGPPLGSIGYRGRGWGGRGGGSRAKRRGTTPRPNVPTAAPPQRAWGGGEASIVLSPPMGSTHPCRQANRAAWGGSGV
ncbi:translation initiation factor IF-2-like [Dromiciops gliroides]|uniref:translation initiation factor IF-2-like n=1 Tax=Dromiciops gliroides TaxID=33562 RepID=UPI001CC5C316|nr:translation initiation factor IF-2-like [Dromiciops gliroides]